MCSRLFISTLLCLIVLTTLFACNSKNNKTENNSKTSGQIEQYASSLPPGTANISATLISGLESDDSSSLLFRIDKVEGYGSSNPPLAIGSEVLIKLSNNLIQNDKGSTSKNLKPGASHRLGLRHIGKGAGREGVAEWEIIKIAK